MFKKKVIANLAIILEKDSDVPWDLLFFPEELADIDLI
jgi:hypothetical protein